MGNAVESVTTPSHLVWYATPEERATADKGRLVAEEELQELIRLEMAERRARHAYEKAVAAYESALKRASFL